ncbi:unnamed protein product [Brachionus calyciflorus]|uniref:Uncharacterized protein n=1 Tax=Brachionus calyciflorus TaxID=104777 RepID=A0A813SL93_9BILA|nr:unnamed protein product [Brachionus calyciflorus]
MLKIFCTIFLLIGFECFKIDFENGNGHLKLESKAVLDGKVVHEPKVEEVIKKLSMMRYREPPSQMTRVKYRLPEKYQKPINGNKKDDVKVEYNDYDIPRVFITNINKNINSNDLAQTIEDEQANYNVQNDDVIYHQPQASYRKLAAKATNQTSTTSPTTTTTTSKK